LTGFHELYSPPYASHRSDVTPAKKMSGTIAVSDNQYMTCLLSLKAADCISTIVVLNIYIIYMIMLVWVARMSIPYYSRQVIYSGDNLSCTTCIFTSAASLCFMDAAFEITQVFCCPNCSPGCIFGVHLRSV